MWNIENFNGLLQAVMLMLCLAAMFLYTKLFSSSKSNRQMINLQSTNTTTAAAASPPPRPAARVPPGSRGWPLIGETLHFISAAYSHSPETFTLKRRRMYGKVFKSHLFGTPTIVSTDAEVSRIVLQSDSRTFVPWYPRSLMELMGKSSILVVNGIVQRRIHGLMAGFLKSQDLKAQVAADVRRYAVEAMANWSEERAVFLQDEAKNIAFRVLVKALISLDGGDEMEMIKKHFQEFIAGLMSLPLKFPGTQLYRSLQAKRKMVKIIDGMIEGKRGKKKYPRIAEDVTDALMNDGENGLVTQEMISENMIDLMIPGEDSVPILITLAIKFLSDSPSALQQITEENLNMMKLKDRLGDALDWNDYLSLLPFTQCVITETLRLGNIIAGVMRKAVKDIVIKGQYMIPKGWCVFAHFRTVHLDDSLYHLPHHFNPWRWLELGEMMMNINNGGNMNNMKFSPFGGGQRLCPGIDLARLEASVFLHHFLTNFRWECEEDSIINFPTVRMKRRMPIWVKRRTIN